MATTAEQKRAWRKRRPDLVANSNRANQANASAKAAGVEGRINCADVASVLPPGVCCVFCGTQESVGIDHRIPLGLGGPNARENLQPCCVSCNSRKGLADRPGRWSRLRDACRECGRSDRPHRGNGLCGTCGQRARRATLAV